MGGMSDIPAVRPVHEKWGAALNQSGFQAVPNVLLSAQNHLGLSTTDLVVVLHLNGYWWDRDRAPYPRPALIARKMGVHRRTVERSLKHLETMGLIERMETQSTQRGHVVRPISLIPLANRLGKIAGGSDSRPPAKDAQSDGSSPVSPAADGTSSKLVPC